MEIYGFNEDESLRITLAVKRRAEQPPYSYDDECDIAKAKIESAFWRIRQDERMYTETVTLFVDGNPCLCSKIVVLAYAGFGVPEIGEILFPGIKIADDVIRYTLIRYTKEVWKN